METGVIGTGTMAMIDEKNAINAIHMKKRCPRVASTSAARFPIDLVDDADDTYIQAKAQFTCASAAAASVIDINEEDNESYHSAGVTVIAIEKSDPNERNGAANSASLPDSRQHKNRKRRRLDIIDIDNDVNVAFEVSTNTFEDDDSIIEIYPNKDLAGDVEVDVDEEVEVMQQDRSPEFIVLDIFPDVDLNYVKHLLENNNHDTTNVIQAIAGDPKYPKSDVETRPSHRDSSVSIVIHDSVAENKYDYMSPQSFVPELKYIVEARNRLFLNFPFLSKVAVEKLFRASHQHYAICHEKVLNTLKTTGTTIGTNQDYEQVLAALGAHPLSHLLSDVFEKLYREAICTTKIYKRPVAVVKRPRKPLRDANALPEFAITDPILQDEVVYVERKLNEWLGSMKKQVDRKARQVSAQQEKKAFECACCFDSFHWGDLISCQNEQTVENPHLFCVDCMCNMIKSKVFGDGNLGYDKETKELAIDLQCFHGDGCSFSFHQSNLAKVIPTTLMKKYEELQFQLAISKAGIASVHACPKCGYKCDVPDTQNVFSCPVASCMYESCRLCGEASHIPLRCDEVVKDRVETAGRTTVEEAITAAKIRECPSCKKSFIKSDGCNKIRCGCGAFICYICRKQIKDYSHFCQTPHCDHSSCKGCVLYTKAEEDDLRAMREAGLHAAKQHKEAKIDVDKIIGTNPVAAFKPPDW
jgi:E3 ubiquitin-protein ligase RNF216